MVEMLEREEERVRAKEQKKQTGQRLQCVSGQRGVSECSPPLFSRARAPGGLSAPGAVIYHQSGEAGPPLRTGPERQTHVRTDVQSKPVDVHRECTHIHVRDATTHFNFWIMVQFCFNI